MLSLLVATLSHAARKLKAGTYIYKYIVLYTNHNVYRISPARPAWQNLIRLESAWPCFVNSLDARAKFLMPAQQIPQQHVRNIDLCGQKFEGCSEPIWPVVCRTLYCLLVGVWFAVIVRSGFKRRFYRLKASGFYGVVWMDGVLWRKYDLLCVSCCSLLYIDFKYVHCDRGFGSREGKYGFLRRGETQAAVA